MAIILPELPYAYDALEPYIDEETMHLHHDKHHQTYVNNVNAALEKHPEIGEDLESLLANVESIPADIRQAVINNGGGHLNHALFWELMTPEQTAPSAELAAVLMPHLVHLKTSKQPSQQQQRHVLVLAGHGWLLTKKGNLKSLQQQTKIHQSLKEKHQSLVWMFGNMLTT